MGLFDLFSNDTAEQAAQQRNAGLQQGYDALSGQFDNARTAINTGANTATGYYQPLIASTGAGSAAYGDASGANGAAGTAKAYDAFKNSGAYGGFNFAKDAATQAIDRTHAAAGNLNSGNADADTANYVSGLAGNTWNNYVSGLAPYLGANSSAVGGAAGVATGQGTALANTDVAQGGAANANYTGQGASNAAATMNNYNVGSNVLGAITGIGGLALGAGGGGLTSGLSSLFGGFGSSQPSTGATSPGQMGGVRYPQF